MKRVVQIILYAIIIAFLVGFTVFLKSNPSPQLPPQINDTVVEALIPISELAIHNSSESCWVLFRGKVYDITSFLPEHPGSAQAILPYCGTINFENAFMKKHGESKIAQLLEEGELRGELE